MTQHQPQEQVEVEITPEIKLTNHGKNIELIQTFRHMTWRKLSRLRNGHLKRKTTAQVLWTVLVTLLFFAMAGIFATRSTESIPIQIIVLLFVCVSSWIIVKISLKLRWFLFWIVCAVISMAFFVDFSSLPSQQMRTEIVYILIVFGSLELLTLCGYLFSWYVYPRIVLHPWIDPTFWWSIKLVECKPNHWRFTYKTFKYCWTVTREFTYEGELDPETKRPCGYGQWTDNSVAGEYLTGYWKDGIPIGPFNSNEYATGFSFANIRVGFCIATADKWDELSLFPKHSENGLTFGVCGIECSLSGKFFEDLPRANMIEMSNSTDYLEINRLVDLLTLDIPGHSKENIPQITVALENGNLVVPGMTGDLCRELTLIASGDEILIDGWSSNHSNNPLEAVIFVPGFNCPLNTAMERVGQMLALINFPSNIVTFVYNWPAGKIITYHKALEACTDEITIKDFCQFVSALHRSGRFKCFHILGHSMGARLVLNASKEISELFCETSTISTENKPIMSTFTLINPEASLDAFTQEHYSKIADVCSLISLFVDESDGALKWAELFSRQRMLGRYATRHLRKRHMNSERSRELQRSDSDSDQSSHGSNTPQVAGRSLSLASIDNHSQKRKSRLRLAKVDMTFIGFDLDVLDMTQLDANVHELRHCYFNINRLVLDDLRDIIVMKKRAKYRANRLLRVDANVFTFISAPSYLVNP